MTIALRTDSTVGAAPESVVLLDGGGQAYPRMLVAIEKAQRTIHLEVYAFTPTGVGARFIEALGNAARRGVKVQIEIDGWGSVLGGRTVADALKASGCVAHIYNRMRVDAPLRTPSKPRVVLPTSTTACLRFSLVDSAATIARYFLSMTKWPFWVASTSATKMWIKACDWLGPTWHWKFVGRSVRTWAG
jgi:hypothetical protein